ncbi:MAG: FIST N-terminal domain-containing protein [Granulosicoccus sp.]
MTDSRTYAVDSKTHASGITIIWSKDATAEAFCKVIAEAFVPVQPSLTLIWYSSTRYCEKQLVDKLGQHTPTLNYCGCSTTGEVTPDGFQDHGIIAIMFPSRWFTAAITTLPNIETAGMQSIAQQASAARNEFTSTLNGSHGLFALNLIDGLTYSEESVMAALERGLDGIPLIGGSAGDDLRFERTTLICNGLSFSGAALLILVECKLPHRLFTENNFVPTAHKLVVTESDPEKRNVREFNAEPAALAFAKTIGIDPSQLDSYKFASNPLVVRIGGEYYCRAIQKINNDQSLTFFCAIDNGLVLTISRSEGMVQSSHTAIQAMEKEIGPIDMILGFDCIYRKLDARNRQATNRIESLYQKSNLVGFHAYGEQFNSMHINQTLTGIAFGFPGNSDDSGHRR